MIKSSNVLRNQLVKNLIKDILGPDLDKDGNPILDEELKLEGKYSVPTTHYITGYLSPREWSEGEEDIERMVPISSSTIVSSDQDSISMEETEENESNEKGITQGKTMQNPSTMGISFVISKSFSGFLKICFSWGEYESTEDGWKRTDFNKKVQVSLSDLIDINKERIWNSRKDSPEFNDNSIYATIKTDEIDESRTYITIRLVNDRESEDDRIKNSENTIFQTNINVSGPLFLDSRNELNQNEDPTMDLLYLDSKIFARGHNVSVDWNSDFKEIYTSWIPSFEVRRSEENSELKKYIPPMSNLYSKSNFSKSLDQFSELTKSFQSWSNNLENWRIAEGSNLNTRLSDRLSIHIENINQNILRMNKGINILRNDKDASKAFRYANEAIFESQRCLVVDRPDFSWKPFQISFILLNLSGLLWEAEDYDEADRQIIDLAWFPTGGGKTEAYLGLVAIIGFYRNLKGVDSLSSVHAIMRYTLRLLTLNQAERATRLMIAMNLISEKYSLGCNEFFVGMWVGSSASPNRLEEAAEIRDKIISTNRSPKNGITPILLDNCPWCGNSEEEPRDRAKMWSYDNKKKTFRGKCSNQECIVSKVDIPFTCIDEEIYNNPPSLLIGTVDKFAQLASKPEARVLLGLQTNDNHRRHPDLIIQDELHLLTGPLGSMAGLYETVFEVLWKASNHSAKYVAATATIKGIEKDSKIMFGRSMNIFPPPGRSIKDNFFSQEDEINPGRRHLAILGNISNNRTILNQPLANLLQQPYHYSQKFEDKVSKESIEPYHTCMVYFNSLRELSGATTALEDSVKGLIDSYARRYQSLPRSNINSEELFSRKKSEELKRTLDNLQISSGEKGSLDTCFTTNMFQVGVDVDRLGLMLINGQPKSNSEYIQASGRVGRKKEWPGLVVSILRASKPRDLSHYEMHRHFHQEMYRYVDVTTTTPFSPRAFDHALPSILMLLCRQGVEDCGPNDNFHKINIQHNKRKIRNLISLFWESIDERLPPSIMKSSIEDKIFKSQNLLLTAADKYQNSDYKWRGTNGKKGWGAGYYEKGIMDPNRYDTLNILESLRNVSDDVFFADILSSDSPFGKTPISQIFSHALPGGLWDFDGDTFLTLGINQWSISETSKMSLRIDEPVLKSLFPNNKMFKLPTKKDEGHITVSNFPWTYRCDAKPESHLVTRPVWNDNAPFCSYPGCEKEVRQVRFVSLCSHGHLSQFNWDYWVSHKENCQHRISSKKENLHHLKVKLEPGYQFDLESWKVICRECGALRSLRGVTTSNTKESRNEICSSYLPWIGNTSVDEQDILDFNNDPIISHKVSHRQRGSSSIAIPKKSSVLLIHPTVNPDILKRPQVEAMVQVLSIGTLDPKSLDNVLKDLYNNIKDTTSLTYDEVIYEVQKFVNQEDRPTRINLRSLELAGIAHGNLELVEDHDGYFTAETIFGGGVSSESPWFNDDKSPLNHITKLERVTELECIEGVSRLESLRVQDISSDEWIIGKYNYGEGIFIGVKPSWLKQKAQNRDSKLTNRDELVSKMISDIERLSLSSEIIEVNDGGEASSCLPILHTFSHMIIKEMCKESGYSLGSIRERLYLESDEIGNVSKAGILFYTTGASSDGTLGGLASMGTRDKIEKITKLALSKLMSCSNDPICNERRPSKEDSNGAACHACVLLPETCCELRNFALDRRWY
jgi:hypothetical protein